MSSSKDVFKTSFKLSDVISSKPSKYRVKNGKPALKSQGAIENKLDADLYIQVLLNWAY